MISFARLRRRPAEVARQGQAPAAAHRVAIDHRDGRLLDALEQAIGALEEPAELALRPAEGRAPLLRGHGGLESRVGAGGEDGRRARDDHHADRDVVAQLGERRRQLGQHWIAQRVAALGTVQGDGRDRAVAGQADVLAHARGR